jgi:hypothetical protein
MKCNYFVFLELFCNCCKFFLGPLRALGPLGSPATSLAQTASGQRDISAAIASMFKHRLQFASVSKLKSGCGKKEKGRGNGKKLQ